MEETRGIEGESSEQAARGEYAERSRVNRAVHFATDHPVTTVVTAAAAGVLLGAELLTGAVVGLAAVLALGARKRDQRRKRLH
jgi:hypothetical protein